MGRKCLIVMAAKCTVLQMKKKYKKIESTVLTVVIPWQQLLNLSFIVLKLQLKILQTAFLISSNSYVL